MKKYKFLRCKNLLMKEKMKVRYSKTSKEKENGVVYTPVEMADYVSAEMLKYGSIKGKEIIEVLDPAVGKGELLISMINTIKSKYNNSIRVVGYETDSAVCKETEKRIKTLFPDVEVFIKNEDFLNDIEEGKTGTYDFVIANPPYIRTQILGSDRAQKIAEKLSLYGKIDIYYAFLVCTKEVLKDDGVSGYIRLISFSQLNLEIRLEIICLTIIVFIR